MSRHAPQFEVMIGRARQHWARKMLRRSSPISFDALPSSSPTDAEYEPHRAIAAAAGLEMLRPCRSAGADPPDGELSGWSPGRLEVELVIIPSPPKGFVLPGIQQ